MFSILSYMFEPWWKTEKKPVVGFSSDIPADPTRPTTTAYYVNDGEYVPSRVTLEPGGLELEVLVDAAGVLCVDCPDGIRRSIVYA